MALTAKKVYAILKRQISDMEAKLNSPVRYRGTVATADLLPLNPDIGDMYNIESKSIYGEAGMNVAWNGVVWDTMGAPIDMSLYLTKEEAERVIQRLVTEYFEKNPVKPGATTEQAQQIEQNKTDIASLKTETGSLKEDISTKITKFYTSSQGETHLADSDNGKIQDMMLYGKSEQKQYSGKNLLNPTLQTTTQNGVTCTNNGDGTYTVNGTATGIAVFVVYYNFADVYGSASSLKMVGCPSGGSAQKYFLRSYRKGGNPEILDEYGSGISIGSFKESESNIAIIVKSGATVNNLIFKPMLTTDTTATYADFEPYTGGIPSPNPDYPQEIKSVVNPTVKVCGKNLLNPTLQTTTQNRVTCTNNGDGTYALNGSNANIPSVFTLGTVYLIKDKKYKMAGCPANPGKAYLQLRTPEPDNVAYKNDYSSGVEFVIPKSGEYIVRIYYDVETYNNLLFKPMLTTDLTATYNDFEPYHEQTVTLPYTLNAIPVSAGGNVTIDGQQYISDYADVERGKLVNMVDSSKLDNTQSIVNKTEWLLAKPQEIDLTQEEVQAFKTFVTYYPTTNISVNSEQLDGYTVFNYPISMANGWNYVKKQLNDNRDYIYDMDIQSAEAYVNSEYAVALTELEV